MGKILTSLRMPMIDETRLIGAGCRQLSRRFSKFDLNQPVNLEAELAKVKQEAKSQLAKDKEDVEKGYLTPDQIISRIIEITDLESFKSKVVERKKPLVLFCMAKWCATSKQIMPFVLEKFSQNYQAWDLAILDIEKDPKISTLLKINKVPTVLLVFNGDVIDGKHT